MGRVKLVACRVSPGAAGRTGAAFSPEDVEADDVAWAKFGDEVVYFGQDQNLRQLVEAAGRAGLTPREHPGPIDRERLHVVIQKGRLFQREHPGLEVLIDKGRFLLVDMDPQQAREADRGRVPCYSVRRLEALDPAGTHGQNRVVFEWRDRAADRAAARAPDPVVQELVNRISRPAFEEDLIRLVEFHTRFSNSPHYVAACDFADQQFAALGYTTSRQSITVRGLPSQNVVARRNGSGPAPRGLVLVTAHLDSVNEQGSSSSRAPGADDDGSGSAGVIEIARALKDHSVAHDLCFVLFGGEEQGLLGSDHFVASMTVAERAQVRAVVNMDMIGTLNTLTPSVLLEGAPLSQGIIEGLATAAATYTGLAVQTSLNPERSDHVPFIENGMPAVLTIEGADGANDEIHTARDTLEHINFDLALEILRMNAAFVAETLGQA